MLVELVQRIKGPSTKHQEVEQRLPRSAESRPAKVSRILWTTLKISVLLGEASW